MMSELMISPYADMRRAINAVIQSHRMIGDEIRNHAIKHAAKLDAMRKSAEIEARVNEGIARQHG